MPICSKCGGGKETSVQTGQDNSTYICEQCQDLKDLSVFKEELKSLEKIDLDGQATGAQIRRIEFLKKRISAIEKR